MIHDRLEIHINVNSNGSYVANVILISEKNYVHHKLMNCRYVDPESGISVAQAYATIISWIIKILWWEKCKK